MKLSFAYISAFFVTILVNAANAVPTAGPAVATTAATVATKAATRLFGAQRVANAAILDTDSSVVGASVDTERELKPAKKDKKTKKKKKTKNKKGKNKKGNRSSTPSNTPSFVPSEVPSGLPSAIPSFIPSEGLGNSTIDDDRRLDHDDFILSFGPISCWDTRDVTDMAFAFASQDGFSEKVGCWNVTGVTDMSNMFKRATLFNEDLSIWGGKVPSNITTTDMFKDSGCEVTSPDPDTKGQPWCQAAPAPMAGPAPAPTTGPALCQNYALCQDYADVDPIEANGVDFADLITEYLIQEGPSMLVKVNVVM